LNLFEEYERLIKMQSELDRAINFIKIRPGKLSLYDDLQKVI
jgi:hypothetical protein